MNRVIRTRYNPVTNTWTPQSVNAELARLEREAAFMRSMTWPERLRNHLLGQGAWQIGWQFLLPYLLGPSTHVEIPTVIIILACAAIGLSAVGYRRYWARRRFFALMALVESD